MGKNTFGIFIFNWFSCTSWSVHSRNTTSLRSIWNCWLLLSLCFYILLGWFHWFWSKWFFTLQTSTFTVAIYWHTLWLAIFFLFIILRIHLYLYQHIACILEISNNCIDRFFADSQLPFRIFNQYFHNLNWMLFFQNFKSFIVSCMLFGWIRSDSCKFYPKFCLKGRLCLFNATDSLKLVFPLLGHKSHFGLPYWFL